MKASVLIAVTLQTVLEICLNTSCKRDLLLSLMSKVPILGFVHRVLLLFLFDSLGQELHPSVCLPDAVCSGTIEKPPGFKAGSTYALITLVSGQAFRRLSKFGVFPSTVLTLILIFTVLCCMCHCAACTADVVLVAVLCRTRVGLVEEIASHSSVCTCLNFM